MQNLMNELDEQEDQLVENATIQKQPQPVSYNKQEELENKYAVSAPTAQESKPVANPFQKKRLIDEISNSKPDPAPITQNQDVEMEQAANDSGSKELTEKMAAASVSEP